MRDVVGQRILVSLGQIQGKPKYNPRYSRRDQHKVTQGAQGHYQGPTGLPYDSDYELQADSVQVIYCDQGKTNIKFDEINNSQALGDLTLLNKRGQQLTRGFSWAVVLVPICYLLVYTQSCSALWIGT